MTRGARPVWLLDVDGVVNASRPGWGGPPKRAQVLAEGEWWKLRWAEEVVDFVRSVHLSGRAEVRWATTWLPWVSELERLWRLPALPVAFGADSADLNAAKLPAALAVVQDEGRPLVWTDDEQIPGRGPARALLTGSSVPVLLLSPSPSRGLRPADVEAIDAFLPARG